MSALVSEGEQLHIKTKLIGGFRYQVKLALWSMFPTYIGLKIQKNSNVARNSGCAIVDSRETGVSRYIFKGETIMAEKTDATKTLSGLPPSDAPRKHYDLYAILEAPQELYFGDEKEVNVNMIEKVRVWTPDGEKEKCYISPTSGARGTALRVWSDAGGTLLMDRIECGIPNTCCKTDCPVCRVLEGWMLARKPFRASQSFRRRCDSISNCA